MTKSIVRSMRGLSPVIATVILVSVTIVVAVAVAYWMGGIAGLYTRFEKIEITSAYAVKDPTSGNYTVTVQLKNSGSQDSSMAYVLVNGRPSEDYLDASNNGQIIVSWTIDGSTGYLPGESMTVPLGKSGEIVLEIDGGLYESGTTLDLKFHSAAGKDYPQMLALP